MSERILPGGAWPVVLTPFHDDLSIESAQHTASRTGSLDLGRAKLHPAR
ncbi:hypothetical protein JOD63_003076 [Microbacterium terrae]|uniref:Uncharacterized protein n=1 Tax=Microbacterium terrae TaxID=69369 RepID=A0A0M2H2C6_9MICO|nr:hypothetical protein RS81_01651 [Microbacterium terrae]MBP1079108.1 hypothetical protein [Microbacterium terrae]